MGFESCAAIMAAVPGIFLTVRLGVLVQESVVAIVVAIVGVPLVSVETAGRGFVK